MTPFYVLYDFRIVCAHLTSDESREETLQSVCSRLGAEQNNLPNQEIYDLLVEQLVESIQVICCTIDG
jgi:hypothetical protein